MIELTRKEIIELVKIALDDESFKFFLSMSREGKETFYLSNLSNMVIYNKELYN